ncbi:hypothetical protein PILCRDRAFT_828637, partial [Piloderma croceum F 1598]
MVEGKLLVGMGSISLHVEAGSMTASYCGNCRRVDAVRQTGGGGRVVSGRGVTGLQII